MKITHILVRTVSLDVCLSVCHSLSLSLSPSPSLSLSPSPPPSQSLTHSLTRKPLQALRLVPVVEAEDDGELADIVIHHSQLNQFCLDAIEGENRQKRQKQGNNHLESGLPLA